MKLLKYYRRNRWRAVLLDVMGLMMYLVKSSVVIFISDSAMKIPQQEHLFASVVMTSSLLVPVLILLQLSAKIAGGSFVYTMDSEILGEIE